MGIIKKTILIIIVIFTVILASSFFYLRFFILNGFSSLETDQIELDTNHVLKLISTQAVELEKSATDYAMWDDLYYFANGQDDSFNTEVLRISVENLSVNLISVIDTDYNLLFSFLYDPADKKEIGLSTTSLQALSGEIKPAVSGIHSSPEITNTSGIFNIDGKPALFAAAKIFKSDRSGDPAGYFIISKYMDRSMADFLSEELAHPVKFIDISRINSQNDYTQVLKNIKNSKSSLFIKYLSLDQAFSYSVLKDISGNDVLLVEVTHSRDVYRNGLTATWNFFYIFALIAAISGITIILSLRLFVLNRLTALSDSAEKMIFESSVTKTLHSKGNDEISKLARTLDDLLKITKKDEEKIRESEKKFREIIELLPEILVETDTERRIVFVNNIFFKITGYTQDDLNRGLYIDNILVPDDIEIAKTRISEALKGRKLESIEYTVIKRDKTTLPVLVSSMPIFDSSGNFNGFRSIAMDITEGKKFQDEIKRLAFIDPLTGLPNRALFNEKFKMLTADSNRHKKKFALMVIDIDNFKNINDNYSHSVGDEILIKASKRIESLLRSTDSIARIGGDEFVLLVSEINTPKDAEMVAAKILVSFNEKIKSSDLEIRISLSMGIAIYPDNGLSLEELFRKADSAMYFVKESGRNNFSFYK